MAFASAGSLFRGDVPLHFYQVKQSGETTENIAAKFNVDVQKVLQDNPGIQSYTNGHIPVGEMIVLNLKV